MTQPHCCQTALRDDSTPGSLDNRPSNALTSSDYHIIIPSCPDVAIGLRGATCLRVPEDDSDPS